MRKIHKLFFYSFILLLSSNLLSQETVQEKLVLNQKKLAFVQMNLDIINNINIDYILSHCKGQILAGSKDFTVYFLHAKISELRKEHIDAIQNATICIDLIESKDLIDSEEDNISFLMRMYRLRSSEKRLAGDYRGSISDADKYINYNVKLYEAKNLESYDQELLAVSYYDRAMCNAMIGEIEKGILDFDRCINLDPTLGQDGELFAIRGLLKLQIDDVNGGCTDFSRAGELGTAKAYEYINEYCK